ncbi:tRNA pseudouridine(55) synthase TruB [Cellulosilyticum ruminicola]|uniref:tRNA pseudouridine(55) synthase TruB n=1 Tax=Cellulosilyticum ruminicola TaxID=425254 RepID=UPI0006D17148|nr:tRNA pseudouridine(55) synthase TruB [Cellulosilyticum ruminicola]
MLNGIINVYKECGYTSHDVVAKVRGILRERRVGHTGTLDPEAEGVLPLCIGPATKVVPYLTDADKCYEAEVILGVTTTTEDATGEILETRPVNVTKEQVEEVVKSFIGTYEQIPPMYSAIKVNGVRLYELARKGIVVERPKRQVTIYNCEIVETLHKNRFKIRVHCSKGTYIRTLCTDIGEKLGCGAHMGTLLRTKVGHYELEDSLKLSELEAVKEQITEHIEGLEEIFKNLPKCTIKASLEKLLYNGNALKLHAVEKFDESYKKDFIRIYDTKGSFIALYKWDEAKKCLQVERMFLS